MKSIIFLFFLLVGFTVIYLCSLWWKVQPLTPCKCKGVLERNDLFPLQIQAHQELAKLINSSKEKNRKHKETKYIMGISEEEQNIKDIADTLQIPWKLNISNVYKLRNEIAKSVHTEMILNQNDVKLSENIRYMNQNKTVTISKKFYNMLPKISPIKGNNKRCAIVGNGGILSGSKCGNEIDMADFVIRFGGLRKQMHHSSFIKSIRQYNNYIWFPSLSTATAFSYCLKANDIVNRQSPKNRNNITVLNGNPNHFREISRYWKNNYNISKTISTGFYITTSALLYCEEIHLYGFWPFYTDLNNRPVAYHYYENVKLNRYVHSFGKEFKELLRLHTDGVLKLHVDKCSL
ncbi:alpha-N-acetylneuraminide alpha-2,8-sialyltransferase-like isoform X2 [Anneissia japonica]|uniref:alpha-N-acetylneuraminide alpha-2,8-sialyltransferase-like isoform X2 n=1 Tax=Anneissia japonica TaxID=1529436 RepID=UPI0014259675|nr:alpha-N-acetylneuraminide alpha-2,8-sialyltransferase-like isoform X2 [Anneissia japonica]